MSVIVHPGGFVGTGVSPVHVLAAVGTRHCYHRERTRVEIEDHAAIMQLLAELVEQLNK